MRIGTRIAITTLCFLALAILFVAVQDAEATDRTVGTGGTYATIQDAINVSAPGDNILVYAGTYTENIIVNQTVNIIGNDTSNTTIVRGTGSLYAMIIESEWVNVTGFNFTGTAYSIAFNGANHSRVYDNIFVQSATTNSIAYNYVILTNDNTLIFNTYNV